jgi:2,5-diketo-D-gluconate reductase B
MEKGAVPIPKATSREHIVDNLRARELDLTDDEIRRIDEIDNSDRQYDPDYAPQW